MKIDIDELSDELASDLSLSDYDFWRALRTVNDEIFSLGRRKAPVPMQFLHVRAILRKARAKRRSARGEKGRPLGRP